jgi:hypothetical protein
MITAAGTGPGAKEIRLWAASAVLILFFKSIIKTVMSFELIVLSYLI